MAKATPGEPKGKRGTKAAVVTGSGTGLGIAGFAQALREPFQTWVVLSAPPVSAFVAAYWPLVLDWAKSQFDQYKERRAIKYAVKELDAFIRVQTARLNSEQLDEATRKWIEEKVAQAQYARVHKELTIITVYVEAAGKLPKPDDGTSSKRGKPGAPKQTSSETPKDKAKEDGGLVVPVSQGDVNVPASNAGSTGS